MFKLFFRFLSFFLLGVLLTFVNTGVLANQPIIKSEENAANALELVEMGKKSYDLGQFQASITDLEAAVTAFAQQGEQVNQAITLSNLSLAYQQLGAWEQAKQALDSSLELLNYNLAANDEHLSSEEKAITASILNIYGGLCYRKGDSELALEYWKKAENIYNKINQQQGIVTSKINQIQALETLGLYKQLQLEINDIQEGIAELPLSSRLEVLKSLADSLQTLGYLKESEQILVNGLNLAKENNAEQVVNGMLLSLGNTYWSLGRLERDRAIITQSQEIIPWMCQTKVLPPAAVEYYQKAQVNYQAVIDSFPESNNALKSKINLFNLLVEIDEKEKAKLISDAIDINKLPPSQSNTYAEINYASNLVCLWKQNSKVEDILLQAKSQAENLQDYRALSYAEGNLGGYYEYLSLTSSSEAQLLAKAEELTEQALLLAQPNNIPSIAYQWQWQLGRINARLGNQEEAIEFYQNAVETLKNVRRDLAGITTDVQFSFRDNVEPVYRQLVQLLLTYQEDNPSQATLASAVNLIDSLQLAELENFLSCDLTTIATNSPTANRVEKAAVIYPIILDKSLYVIYQLPNQSLQYQINSVSNTEVEETVTTLRKAIARRNPEVFRANSEKVYQWLIKPLENYLNQDKSIDTLVFILDGPLRNIPMGVLYDSQNQEYLLEKDYALAVLPTSQLFQIRSSSNSIKVLAGGISEALEVEDKEFEAIDVQAELQEVEKLATTQTLLNADFTQANLEQQLNRKDYSIVHLATHGNFSSDPQQTYLLAYGKLLRANDLNNLLRLSGEQGNSSVDLLILSACETASGDNRATLGLAGLAIRAGAKATMASLWRVSDEYTIPLITRFYENLNQGLSKAQALHQAQKSLIYREIDGQKYQNDPYDWGAYILVGNWQ